MSVSRHGGAINSEWVAAKHGGTKPGAARAAPERLRWAVRVLCDRFGRQKTRRYVVRFSWSESTTGKRIGAARAARRFPVLFDMVARGTFTSAVSIGSKRTARLAPQPDVPSRLRKLPDRAPTGGETAAAAGAGSEPPRGADGPGASNPAPNPVRRNNVTFP